jgi:methyl-accepting chemotaxis protein
LSNERVIAGKRYANDEGELGKIDMFKQMKVSIRLWLLVLVAVTALLTMAGEALLIFCQTMLDDRQINARNVVETAYGVITHYGDLTAAQKLGQEEAKAQALAVLRGLRGLRYEILGRAW